MRAISREDGHCRSRGWAMVTVSIRTGTRTKTSIRGRSSARVGFTLEIKARRRVYLLHRAL